MSYATNAKFKLPDPYNEPIYDYKKGCSIKNKTFIELERLSSAPTHVPNVIDGKKESSPKQVQVTCPHQHEKVIAVGEEATQEQIQKAIQSCVKNRPSWAAMSYQDRASIFLKAADLITQKYRPLFNAATMLGQSKTIHQSEIDAVCELADFFRFNVKFMERIYEEQPQSPKGQWNRLEARGLEGFIYAITPFNFTSIAVNLPTAPALMGCSVLWKPARTTLLSSHVAMNILEEAGLPPGVINMVSGDPNVISHEVLSHTDLAGIHFTGSTSTFNLLWKKVGENIDRYKTYPRLIGETGGKDFVFAHPSCDHEALSTALIRGAFEYQGQKCSAASRAYVPQSVWQKMKSRFIDEIQNIRMGDVGDCRNFMGAVIDERSFVKLKSAIDEAKKDSKTKIIAGGECDRKTGWFIRPTVIETTDPYYRTMCEELFGPILTLFVYDDSHWEEVLKICEKSSPYALTGAIFAQDRRAISQMAKVLENAAGNFYINDKPTGAVVGQQPFGGARASGTNDKAGSIYNLMRWTSHRTIKETFVPPIDYRYPFMES